jgi:hypothetical protein
MRFGMTFSTIRDISMLTVMTAGASHICMGTRIGKLLGLGSMALVAVGLNVRRLDTRHRSVGIGVALKAVLHGFMLSMGRSMTGSTRGYTFLP